MMISYADVDICGLEKVSKVGWEKVEWGNVRGDLYRRLWWEITMGD